MPFSKKSQRNGFWENFLRMKVVESRLKNLFAEHHQCCSWMRWRVCVQQLTTNLMLTKPLHQLSFKECRLYRWKFIISVLFRSLSQLLLLTEVFLLCCCQTSIIRCNFLSEGCSKAGVFGCCHVPAYPNSRQITQPRQAWKGADGASSWCSATKGNIPAANVNSLSWPHWSRYYECSQESLRIFWSWFKCPCEMCLACLCEEDQREGTIHLELLVILTESEDL